MNARSFREKLIDAILDAFKKEFNATNCDLSTVEFHLKNLDDVKLIAFAQGRGIDTDKMFLEEIQIVHEHEVRS